MPALSRSARCSSTSPDATADLQRDHLTRVAISAGTATTDELDDAVADLNEERDTLDGSDATQPSRRQVDQARRTNEEQKAEYEQARQPSRSRAW